MSGFAPAQGKEELPLWEAVALRVCADESAFDRLTESEHAALFDHAVESMQPDPSLLQRMQQDAAQRRAYSLTYVRFFKAGRPPLSTLMDDSPMTPPPSE